MDALTLHPPQMAYDLPAGGNRLMQGASGYGATIVSGVGDAPRRRRHRRPARSAGARRALSVIQVRPPSPADQPALPPSDAFNVCTAVVAEGVSLSFVREGIGGTPLLLIHGYPETKRIWWRNIAALAAAGFEVIAPDLRGRRRQRPSARRSARHRHLLARPPRAGARPSRPRVVRHRGQRRRRGRGHRHDPPLPGLRRRVLRVQHRAAVWASTTRGSNR